ncbi:acidic mammalian chitinase-like [Pollicipes pollicipes]|uniref:acidic mammalian chitinase-like n=1 Tax=Pollicipes pollicipes TaxID=41117 RepID=UPI00188502B6|nr:acidic mammalian chitinase-like [Pollicipes pollicipes]
MAYNYHGKWQPFTGHVAPMYASHLDIQHGNGYQFYNVNYTIHHYLEGGADPSKVVVGIPFHGNGFSLQSPGQHGLYAPVSGPMPRCPYTRQAGDCGFNELCELYFTKPGWTHVHDDEQKTIYSYTDEVWIGYDNLETIRLKSEFIRRTGLAGAMVWAIDLDDSRGVCNLGSKFALLTELWHQMNGELPSTTPGPTTVSAPADQEREHHGPNSEPDELW